MNSCFFMFLNLISCFQNIETLTEDFIPIHNQLVGEKAKNSIIQYYNAIIIQYRPENFEYACFDSLIETFRDILTFKREKDFFYYENFCGKNIDEIVQKSMLSKIPLEIFPKKIFKNSTSTFCDNYQNFNNINLNGELQKDKKHFFYYSNFDAVNIASEFLDKVHDILESNCQENSTSVLVLNDNICEKNRCFKRNIEKNRVI
ncbi:hypothetical protein GVAV_001824 [Gurleya vavrai]